MKKGVIYCYKINDKYYVGKTYGTEKKRQKQHRYDSRHGTQTPFCHAIRKYGWEKVLESYEVLERLEYETLEELNYNLIERENYWIKEKNSLLPNGYNVHFSNHKKIPYVPNKKERYEKVSKALKGRNNNIYLSKRVICVETGKIYPSIGEAERQENMAKGSLTHVLHGKNATTHGKHWRFVDFSNDDIDNRISRKLIAVKCIETNKEYRTLNDCSIDMFGNRNHRKNIKNCCETGKTYHGYHFIYLNQDNPLPSLNNN